MTSPPYPTEIRFRNDGAAPLYLHTGCIGIEYGISSCASGYRDFLEASYQCACSCDSASCTGSVSCGGCPGPAGLAVAPGTFTKVMWDAVVTTGEDRGTYTCVRSRFVSPGRHRVAIRVYDDADSARDLRGGRIVTQDFDLPAALGVLEVPISSAQPDPCLGLPSAATPACTGNEARDAACTLAVSMTYGAEGWGLTIRWDSSTIAPPAAYTLTQKFTDRAAMPDRQCMTSLPLCSRDARVVTTSDLTRVLTNPVLVAAFGTNTPVFGYDSRPADGSILVLRRPDGTSLGIGDARGVAVPPELLEAQAVLSRLNAQMLGDPACANIAR